MITKYYLYTVITCKKLRLDSDSDSDSYGLWPATSLWSQLLWVHLQVLASTHLGTQYSYKLVLNMASHKCPSPKSRFGPKHFICMSMITPTFKMYLHVVCEKNKTIWWKTRKNCNFFVIYDNQLWGSCGLNKIYKD